MDLQAAEAPEWRLEAWRQSLYDALFALPHDVVALGMELRRLGIRGVRSSGAQCPIALYLDRIPFTESQVGHLQVSARPRPDAPLNLAERVTLALHEWPLTLTLPHHIRTFIHAFDGGHFPMLEARVF